jgi:hypothetical protein
MCENVKLLEKCGRNLTTITSGLGLLIAIFGTLLFQSQQKAHFRRGHRMNLPRERGAWCLPNKLSGVPEAFQTYPKG